MLEPKNKKELYVVETVKIGPIDLRIDPPAPDDFLLEGDKSFDIPVADDANTSRGFLASVLGSMSAIDLSKIEKDGNFAKITVKDNGAIFRGKKENGLGKFFLNYANSTDNYYVEPNWVEVANDILTQFASIPAIGSCSIPQKSKMVMIKGNNGEAFVIALVKDGSSDYRIIVGRFNQKRSSDFNIIRVGYSEQLNTTYNLGINDLSQFAACVFSGDICVVVTTMGGVDLTTNGQIGNFNILKLRQSNVADTEDVANLPIFELTAQNIKADVENVNYRIMNGIAISEFQGKLIVAVCIVRPTEGIGGLSNNYEYKINIISTRDLRSWAFQTNNSSELTSIDAYTMITQKSVLCISSVPNALTKSSFRLVGFEDGSISYSSDGGQTWNYVSELFTARNGMPITACHVLPSKNSGVFICYIGSTDGTIMRSVDSGKTWKIVNMKHGASILVDITAKTAIPVGTAFNANGDGRFGEVALNWPNIDYTDFDEDELKYRGTIKVSPGSFDTGTKFHYSQCNSLQFRDTILGFVSQKVNSSDTTNQQESYRLWLYTSIGVALLDDANRDGVIKYDSDFSVIWTPLYGGQLNIVTTLGENNNGFREIIEVKRYAMDTNIISKAILLNDDESAPELLLSGVFETPEALRDLFKDDWEIRPVTVRLQSAHQRSEPIFGYLYDPDPEKRACVVVDIARINIVAAYAASTYGRLYAWRASQDPNLVFKSTASLPVAIDTLGDPASLRGPIYGAPGITTSFRTRVAVTFDDNADLTNPNQLERFLFLKHGHLLLKSVDHAQTWTSHSIQLGDNEDDVVVMEPLERSSLYLGGENGLRIFSASGARCEPSFCKYNNALYLSIANIDDGYYEIWQSTSFYETNLISPKFQWVAPNVGSILQIQPIRNRKNAFLPNTFLRAELITDYSDNVLMLISADKSIVSYDSGGSWLSGASTDNPFPVMDFSNPTLLEAWANPMAKNFIQFAPYGNGPIYAFASDGKGNWKTFISRSWAPSQSSATTQLCPMLQQFYLGASNSKILWHDSPNFGDIFYLKTRNQFPRGNLYVESPSIKWRTANDRSARTDQIPRAISFYWDAGSGRNFHANFCSMFNSNIPFAKWAITVPSENFQAFPTDDSKFTEFTMTSILGRGTIDTTTVANPAAFQIDGVFQDSSGQWPINKFSSGIRNYWIMVAANGGGISFANFANIQIRKIIRNTKNSIIYDGDPISCLPAPSIDYAIFTDRMWNDSSYGTRLTRRGYPEPSLVGTPYEFGRWLRLTIPVLFPTTDKADEDNNYYTQIGKVIFGSQYAYEFTIDGQQVERHGFSAGFRWEASVQFEEELMPAGISVVKRTSRPRQSFELNYEAVKAWEVNSFYQMLTPDYKQAFGFVPDAEDNTSIEWVRLREGAGVTHAGGPYYNHGIILDEVI